MTPATIEIAGVVVLGLRKVAPVERFTLELAACPTHVQRLCLVLLVGIHPAAIADALGCLPLQVRLVHFRKDQLRQAFIRLKLAWVFCMDYVHEPFAM